VSFSRLGAIEIYLTFTFYLNPSCILTEPVLAVWRLEIGARQFTTDLLVIFVLRQPSTTWEHVLLTCRRVFHFNVSQVPRGTHTFTQTLGTILSITAITVPHNNHRLGPCETLESTVYWSPPQLTHIHAAGKCINLSMIFQNFIEPSVWNTVYNQLDVT